MLVAGKNVDGEMRGFLEVRKAWRPLAGAPQNQRGFHRNGGEGIGGHALPFVRPIARVVTTVTPVANCPSAPLKSRGQRPPSLRPSGPAQNRRLQRGRTTRDRTFADHRSRPQCWRPAPGAPPPRLSAERWCSLRGLSMSFVHATAHCPQPRQNSSKVRSIHCLVEWLLPPADDGIKVVAGSQRRIVGALAGQRVVEQHGVSESENEVRRCPARPRRNGPWG